MSDIDEFEASRADLEALLSEVLGAVAGEEAIPAGDEASPPGPVVASRLAIHDEVDDSYIMISMWTSSIVARVLASRMLHAPDPGPDDLLDAVGELCNITGGNVKSLLRHSCRLSLPFAEMTDGQGPRPDLGGVTVRATVFGQVVELSVEAIDDVTGLYWPGAQTVPDALETTT